MVGLLPQGTAVGKKPPTGVGAIFTGSKVEVGVGWLGAGVYVAVGLLLPPPDCVAVGGTGVGVRVGMVWLGSAPQTGETNTALPSSSRVRANSVMRNRGFGLIISFQGGKRPLQTRLI